MFFRKLLSGKSYYFLIILKNFDKVKNKIKIKILLIFIKFKKLFKILDIFG